MAKKEIDLLPITNDYVFKRVFSYEGNEDVLKDLLEAILKRKIKSLEIKNPEIRADTKEEKKGVLDIKAQLDEGTMVDIEMQARDESNMEERSTTYIAKLVSSQLQVGYSYLDLRETIFIGILNFENYKRNSYHHVARMRFDKTEEETYVDMGYKKEEEIATKYMEMHYIEIPKYIKKKPEIKTKLDKWLCLLSGNKEKMEMVVKENKNIKKAMTTLERISLDPVEREKYESVIQAEFLRRISEKRLKEKAIAEGKAEGIAEGEVRGRAEATIKMAKKLLAKKIPLEEIVEITGLKKEEIKKIK